MDNNSNTGLISQSLLKEYISLYKIVGKGENNYNLLKSKHNYYHDIAIEDDIFYSFKLVYKNSKIDDSRIKKFASKQSLETIKNKDEQFLKNLKEVFDLIYKNEKFELTYREIIELNKLLYKNIAEGNTLKRTNDKEPIEKKLNKIIDLYQNSIKEELLDPLYVSIKFIVDFVYLSPFTNGNEIISLILLYLLVINSDIVAFKYTSFFKELNETYDEYNKCLNKAFYLYEDGLSDISPLLKYIFKISINAYKIIEDLVKDLEFDKKLKKSSIVESYIYKLNDKFSKNEIERALPGVSKSTIDRTLKELSLEGRIQAFGVGRSAKWIRLDHSKDDVDIFR